MKNSEEAIERVLAGLREVETPDGMERRILDGLEGRAAQARSGWRRSMPMRLVMPQGRFPAMRKAGRAPVRSRIDVAGVKVVPMAPSGIGPGDGERASPGSRVPWRGT